ncbi:hypothetical protein [Petrotoga mobilis]|uniref:hypothetical protein n=1 Tax=Petrotoga mobilis TaxID=69499 RepID=UPI0005A063BB|nr:hypothetical protein [Petrotoga mobilis]
MFCAKSFLLICAKRFYNALETISIFSFAKQMMLREFGVFKGLALLQSCAKNFLLFCAKRFYNALETISIFSFAKQMMLREFGVFKGLAP